MANLTVELIKDEVSRSAAGDTEMHYGYPFTVAANNALDAIMTEAQAAPLLYSGRVKVKGELEAAVAARLDAIVKRGLFDAASVALATATLNRVNAQATLTDASAKVVAAQVIETAAQAAYDAVDDIYDAAVIALAAASDAYDTAIASAVSTGATSETPAVTAFTVGAVTGTTVVIASFTGSDNKAVAAYIITESNTVPAIDAAGWNAVKPVEYTSATATTKDIYPWVKDAAGRISGVFATPRNVAFV